MKCKNCNLEEKEHPVYLRSGIGMILVTICSQFECNCMGCKRQSGCLQELAMIEKNKEVK